MPVYLEGVAAQFYRGIGPEMQYIAPFSDMNFFVGPNNAGKSIVLNLIREWLPVIGKTVEGPVPSSVEAYRGKNGTFDVFLWASREQFEKASMLKWERLAPNATRNAAGVPLDMRAYSSRIGLLAERIYASGGLWIKTGPGKLSPHILEGSDWQHLDECMGLYDWNRLARLFGIVVLRDVEGSSRNILRAIVEDMQITIPERLMIPAKREIDATSQTFEDLSGKGLFSHLAELQNPDHHERERKLYFDRTNDFLREVTGKPDAQLEVPNNRQHLLVHMDNKVLPLSSLGTGIHEVILIAAFCTIHQQKIMCIEEPEIHLHPVLQRKLINYLKDNTENQYFIATHSAAFIDTPGACVFRVQNDGVQTSVMIAVKKGDKRAICDELGYRASDILQSNAVIWVEGPSDRTYIRHWLRAFDDRLVEGVHYTIMFYGGGLMSHLSADEDALKQFIQLRDLNQNIAIVIDSDRDSARAKLKSAARRLKDEMGEGQGVVWITKGREIENYVTPDQLHAALKVIHPTIYGAKVATGPYDHAFYFKRKCAKKGQEPIHKQGDKVGVASIVCDAPANLNVLDLKDRIADLAKMIWQANGLGPA